MRRVLVLVCLTLFSSATFATDVCVSSAAELSSALLSAQTDATEVTIRLVRGTYQGRFSFSGESPPQAPLSIIGGYNASCTARVGGQEETVIDGQNFGGASLGGALGLDGWRDFSVENLTIRNGTAGYGGGLGIRSHNWDFIQDFDVRVSNVTVETSRGDQTGGAFIDNDTGDVLVTGSVFRDNETCCSTSSGFESFSSPGAGLYARGRTVVIERSQFIGNDSFDVAGGANAVGKNQVVVANNLFDGNQSRREGGALMVLQTPPPDQGFSVASGDWSVAFTTSDYSEDPMPLDEVATLIPGLNFTGTDILIPENGCYHWLLDATDTQAPTILLTKVNVGTGPGAEKAECGLQDQGQDNTQPFGTELFLRGRFVQGIWNYYGTQVDPAPPRNFINFGDGTLRAEFEIVGGSRPPVIASNTFVNNASGLHGTCVYGCEGGAIWFYSTDDPYKVTNNAFFGNTALDGLGDELGLATDVQVEFVNNALNRTASSFDDPPALDTGNIDTGSPGFGNAAGGDYRPGFGSPLRDAGLTAEAYGDRDLGGTPRVLGTDVDVGAWEFPGRAHRVLAIPEAPGATEPVLAASIWKDAAGRFEAPVRGLDPNWPDADLPLHPEWQLAMTRLAFSPLAGEQELTSLYEGGGIPRVKTLNALTGQPTLDDLTGKPAGTFRFFDGDWQAVDMANIGDIGGSPAQDLAVLAVNRRDGGIVAQIRDGEAGVFLRNLFYLNPDWTPLQLLASSGADGSPAPELGVLATDAAGQIVVMLKDSGSNAFVGNLFFLNGNWQPLQAIALPDFSGNGAQEIGLLAVNKAIGRPVVMVKDSATNTFLRNVFPLGSNWSPVKVVALPDETGNGAVELATLGVNSGSGKLIIQVRDSESGAFIRNLAPLGSNWAASDMVLVEDVGAGVPGLAVLAARKSDGTPVIHTIDAVSGSVIGNVFP